MIKKIYYSKTLLRISIVLVLLLFTNILNVLSQEDKTLELVKDVQEQVKKEYGTIETIQFSGRSKFYDYMGSDAIGLKTVRDFEDCYFDGVWKKPDSLQIIVKAFRRVDPDDKARNYFWADMPLPDPMIHSYDASITPVENHRIDALNKDNSENKWNKNKSFWPIFPFDPGADSLYNYEMIAHISMGSRKIQEIQVNTKSPDTHGVSGVFQIDMDDKDIVGSRYVFNNPVSLLKKFFKAEEFPVLITPFSEFSASYMISTKKMLINDKYWLPQKIVEDVNVKLLGTKISFKREIEFTSYFLNKKQEETDLAIDLNKLSKKKVFFRRDPDLESKVFSAMEDTTKLTKEEENRIIKSIEEKYSSMKLNKGIFDSEIVAKNAIKMNIEQKSRKFFNLAKGISNNFFLYNRVEGIRFLYNVGLTNFLLRNSFISVGGGYGIKDKRWKGEVSFLKFFDRKRKIFIEGNVYDKLDFEENSVKISTLKNSFSSLFFKKDLRDFFYTSGGSISFGYKFTDNLAIKLSGITQNEKSAARNTTFSIFNWKSPFRLNPEIYSGRFNGLQSLFMFENYNLSFNITFEFTNKDMLNSDFSYQFIKSDFQYMYEPGYNNIFILTLSGASSSGSLTPQRWFDFGGKILTEYYGNLRGVEYKSYTGDRMAMALLEYSYCYGTVWDAFSKINWWMRCIRMTKLTFWTGLGWSDLSESSLALGFGKIVPSLTTKGIYNELGFSIGDRFNLFRLDFIVKNTYDKSVLFSFNFIR